MEKVPMTFYFVCYSFTMFLNLMNNEKIKTALDGNKVEYVSHVGKLLHIRKPDIVVLCPGWKNRLDAGTIGILLERSNCQIMTAEVTDARSDNPTSSNS